MLKHLKEKPTLTSRVVILGAGGFVASAIQRKLQKLDIPVLPLSRNDLDLTMLDSGDRLSKLLRFEDVLLFISAKAPVKNEDMLIENLRMGRSVCEALRKTAVSQVVYVSSDAVYADSDQPLSEASSAQPGSLHGIMHLAREIMLSNAYDGPMCFLRPTLIYGSDDPHNGYGPNRFMRLAAAGKDILLFGEGEEQRDHVWVEDVAEIILRVVLNKSEGKLNIATGNVTSFRKIAEMAASYFNNNIKITGSHRIGGMPHNGFRPFDSSNTQLAFPDFIYTSLENGLPLNNKSTNLS